MYSGFADVYDMFMDDVPYDEWVDYLISLLKEYGIEDGLIAELACGTGNITGRLKAAGYDMIGIDSSPEMLAGAAKKENSEDILYLNQDMREFELYGTVKTIVCICDGMNYILEEDELKEVFRLVNNYLDPGGYFIFDMDTLYKYREELAENTFAENRESGSFIWENYYDEERHLNYYDLTLFIRQQDGLYRKFEEEHVKRGYQPERIIQLLEDAGLEFVTAYSAFTKNGPKEDDTRIYYIAKEKGKNMEVKYE